METRRLGRIGHASSVLIFGGAALGECTQDEADASVREALDAGINHFDTAAAYGGSEDRLGPWMADIRDRIFLASKVTERSYDAAWASINRSLERLRTDHGDYYLLHPLNQLSWKEILRLGVLDWLAGARADGRIRHIGFSFHDKYPVFKQIVERYDWDFC